MPRFVMLANPESRRVILFQEALARLGYAPARVVAYEDWLNGGCHLADVIQPGDIVRIESPGKNFRVEKSLLALGAGVPDDPTFARCEDVSALEDDKGRILYSRQWYLGFGVMLRRLEHELAASPPHRLMNHLPDIALMFDKPACHARLLASGVAVPPGLGIPESFEALLSLMRAAHVQQVFVKLAHGSSASGVVAYRIQGSQRSATQHSAATTVEMVGEGDGLRLYNSRRLRVYRDHADIARLMDALCRQRVHVEVWLPKAQMDGHNFDLRILMIEGRMCHIVPRLSASPITNLHLLNQRGDLAALQTLLSEEKWEALRQTSEAAMRLFPHSLHCGLDVLLTAHHHTPYILEMNAFGDLLPGITWRGRDTYTAEIEALCLS